LSLGSIIISFFQNLILYKHHALVKEYSLVPYIH